jgi:hypothetical protein
VRYLVELALARVREAQNDLKIRIDIYVTKSEYTVAEIVEKPYDHSLRGVESPCIGSSASSADDHTRVPELSDEMSGDENSGRKSKSNTPPESEAETKEKEGPAAHIVAFHSGRPDLATCLRRDLERNNARQSVMGESKSIL